MIRSNELILSTAAALLLSAVGCVTPNAFPPPQHEPTPPIVTPPPPPPVAKPVPPPPPPPSTPDAEFRATKPPPLPMAPKFEAPVPVVRKLKNGAEVWILESHAVPIVAMEVLFKAGVNAEPIAKAGLADLATSMLDEGTKSRSATQLAEAIEDLAMEVSASAGREEMRMHLNSLVETFPQALELFTDMMLNPAYRPEDLDRVRKLQLTALEQKKGTPSALAGDEMGRILFGAKHPWGQPSGGTPQTINAITVADLAKFHSTWFRPNNSVIVVAGDVKPDDVMKALEERLAKWKAGPLPAMKLPAWPELKIRAVTFVDKPNASQSQVWVGGRLFPAKDPDTIAFNTANFALGGLFTSRLNLNLRENKGYSYGVFSRLSFGRTYGTMTAAGGIVAKNTAEALTEFEKELESFAKGGLTEEELNRSKEAHIRTLPSRLETNDALAGAYATAAFYDLGPSYYKELPAKIAAVTLADIARVAKHVRSEAWPIIVVGPATENAEKVKALNLGTVEVKAIPTGGAGSPVGAR